jgi:hypothetical protein
MKQCYRAENMENFKSGKLDASLSMVIYQLHDYLTSLSLFPRFYKLVFPPSQCCSKRENNEWETT